MTLPITGSGRNTLTWSTESKIWSLLCRRCLMKKEKNITDCNHIRKTDKGRSRHWIKCGDVFFLRYVNRAYRTSLQSDQVSRLFPNLAKYKTSKEVSFHRASLMQVLKKERLLSHRFAFAVPC